MKILKKLAAITAALAVMPLMSANVFAKEFEDVEPNDVYECTAEDGSKFRMDLDYDCWGAVDTECEFAPINYVIDSESKTVSIPEIDAGYPHYDLEETIPLGDNEYVIIGEIDDVVEASEKVTCYVKGKRFYIGDKINHTVRYLGCSAEYKYIEYDGEIIYCRGTAEDGANYSIALSRREKGEFALDVLAINSVPPKYDTAENGAGISWREDRVFDWLDTSMYGDELLSVKFDIPVGEETVTVYKHYIISLDGENSEMRYYCTSLGLGGTTTSPKTGSGGNYLAVMLTAAAVGTVAKKRRMC